VDLRCRNPPRYFSQLKALEIYLIEAASGQELHLKPTAGCKISALIFDFFLWKGGVY
jgi:hypothetical protein